MNTNPYKSPKQKLVTRLLFSVVCVYFGYLQITRTEIHGVPAGPEIRGGIVFICVAIVAAVITILLYKKETRK